MPSPTILLALFATWVASLAAVGVWQHSAGVDSERVIWQQKQHQAQMQARATEQQLINQLETARNESIEREKRNRIAVADAQRAATGLRDTIGNLRRALSAAPAETCRNTADAALVVFGECSDRYRALAEAADRHANDSLTFVAAWPERN